MLYYRKHIACSCNRSVAATLRPLLPLRRTWAHCVARTSTGGASRDSVRPVEVKTMRDLPCCQDRRNIQRYRRGDTPRGGAGTLKKAPPEVTRKTALRVADRRASPSRIQSWLGRTRASGLFLPNGSALEGSTSQNTKKSAPRGNPKNGPTGSGPPRLALPHTILARKDPRIRLGFAKRISPRRQHVAVP